jgi:hypothetical protein
LHDALPGGWSQYCVLLLGHASWADESVVVIKFRPMKAGWSQAMLAALVIRYAYCSSMHPARLCNLSNGVEGKTGMTLHLVVAGCRKCQKRLYLRREEVQKKITGGFWESKSIDIIRLTIRGLCT